MTINFHRRTLKSCNKNKTTWDIKSETGKIFSNGDIQVLDIEGKISCEQETADALNNFFLENDSLYLLPFHCKLWIVVLGTLFR
jgi:hypothetical protein